MNKRKIIIKAIILIIWMIIIYLFSNQKGSASSNLSNGFLYSIFKIFSLPDSLINDCLIVLIRKLAHFTEYFILGLLIINILKEFKIQHIFIVSALICLLYALTDEIHQLFIDNRVGSIVDVIIDFSGATVGLLGYYILAKLKRKPI